MGDAPAGRDVAALYRTIDADLDDLLRTRIGFTALLATRPYPLDPERRRVLDGRHAAIRTFQEAARRVFRESLAGERDPSVAEAVVGELPARWGADHHRALTRAQDRPPVFFRTDESASGRLSEIQCPGSGWGLATQIQRLYVAHPEVFGPPRHDPLPLPRAFARSLATYLGRPPRVHHLVDNASRPHGMRYFIQRLREEGVPHFSYDGDVAPEDCNFVRAHDFISLPTHNFFADRMARCERGEVFFDLPPSNLYDGKIILAWPFDTRTRDAFPDAVRDLFPYTAVIERESVTLEDGERVPLEGLLAGPRARRDFYLKYAGSDVNTNWGSRTVHLASTLSRGQATDLARRIADDGAHGRRWILQRAERDRETVEAFARDGTTAREDAYAKISAFYGPDGLLGILAMHKRSHKVHGGDDTIMSVAW